MMHILPNFPTYLLLFLFGIGLYSCASESTTTNNNTNSTNTKPISKSPATNKNLPNIVILLADDLGWNDVGYHNSAVKTPYIDALAKEGIELNRFYAHYSCTPSRVGMLTGRYPGRAGLSQVIYSNSEGGLSPDEETLAEFLEKVGYAHRACIGKWHLGHSHVQYHPLNHGFNHFYGLYGGYVDYFNHKRKKKMDWHRNYFPSYAKGYSTELIAEDAVKYINELPDEESFFLYVPFNAPHTPLQAPRKFLDMYGLDTTKAIFKDPKLLPNMEPPLPVYKGQGNTKRQTYLAMVSAMDEAIGQILDAVDKKGQKDNTIVLFFSDNGASSIEGGDNAPFQGTKGSSYEGSIRVPAAIRYPNGFKGQRKIDNLMGYVDIFATLKGLLNLPNHDTQKPMDGLDMAAVLKGQEESQERIFYINKSALVSHKWKLTNRRLFDIEKDPGETQDVAQENAKTFHKLQQTLQKMGKDIEVNVPLEKSYMVRKNWHMPGTGALLKRLKKEAQE